MGEEKNEVAVVEEVSVQAQNEQGIKLFGVGEPAAIVSQVTKVADVLKDVIDKQKLSVKISGRDYVKVEGWCTLGSLLGVFPHCDSVEEIEGGYHATISIRTLRGNVVSKGSAVCFFDEKAGTRKRWVDSEGKPNKANACSMSQTRATGKAFRLPFAWIMSLAGYEPTPAEEMESVPKENLKSAPKHHNGPPSPPGSDSLGPPADPEKPKKPASDVLKRVNNMISDGKAKGWLTKETFGKAFRAIDAKAKLVSDLTNGQMVMLEISLGTIKNEKTSNAGSDEPPVDPTE